MPSLSIRAAILGATTAILGAGIGGCTTMADLSYSEFQVGPGLETEQVYESRLYGDTQRGFGSEACRTTVRREIGIFGEVSAREVTVCDGL